MMKCLYLYSSIGLIVIWSIGEWQRRKWVEGEWAHAIPTFTHAKFTFEQIYYLNKYTHAKFTFEQIYHLNKYTHVKFTFEQIYHLNKYTHAKFTFEQIYSLLTLYETLADNRYFYTLKSDVIRFYAFWHLHVVVSDICVDFMKISF